MSFYRCAHCGKIVSVVVDGGGTLGCCGEPMKALKANTTDAAQEKHVPVVTVEGNKAVVNVGSVDHPITPEDKPHAEFVLQDGEKFVAAYEYCNLHGLWKAEV